MGDRMSCQQCFLFSNCRGSLIAYKVASIVSHCKLGFKSGAVDIPVHRFYVVSVRRNLIFYSAKTFFIYSLLSYFRKIKDSTEIYLKDRCLLCEDR